MPGNSILVVRGGAIGDFILTLPVLAALRRQFPTARLEVLGYPHVARLATVGGLAEDVRPIEARALAGFFARGGTLDPELQAYFDRCAIVVSYLYDPDGIFQENVRRCTRGQFIAGPHRPDDTSGRHATEVLLEPLHRLAIFDADPVPRLPWSGRVTSHRDRVAVHPGSGSERKNWPEPRWAEFLDRLSGTTSRPVLIVGGEAEGDRLERLARRLPAGRVEVMASRPLEEVAGGLADCAAFVGHDSGLSHLAAALGLPTLVLWGPTAAAVWAPRGPRVVVLDPPDGLASLPAATVLAAVARMAAEENRGSA